MNCTKPMESILSKDKSLWTKRKFSISNTYRIGQTAHFEQADLCGYVRQLNMAQLCLNSPANS